VHSIAAAKEEFGAARIANRPATGFFRELQQSLALLNRNFDQFGFGLGLIVIGKRGVTPHRWPRYPHHVSRRAGLAWARRCRGGAFGAAGESQAMNLADHRVARDAAELCGDLTGG